MTEIPLRDEDMQEVLARVFVLRQLEQRERETVLAVHHAHQAAQWIAETLDLPMQKEEDVYALHIDGWVWAKQEADHVESNLADLRRHISLLRDSFALFLSHRYDFNPFAGQWSVSPERKVIECINSRTNKINSRNQL